MITARPGDRGAGNGAKRCLKSRSKITGCGVSKTLPCSGQHLNPFQKGNHPEHCWAWQRAFDGGQGAFSSPARTWQMLRGELISQYMAFLPSIEMKGLTFCHHPCLGGRVLPRPTPGCIPTQGLDSWKWNPLLLPPFLELHRGKENILADCDLPAKAQVKFVMFLS